MEEGGRGRKGGRKNRKEKAKTVEKEEGEGERKKVSIKGAYHFTHLFNSNWFTKLHWSIKILSNGTD